jgi:hypothetical protein
LQGGLTIALTSATEATVTWTVRNHGELAAPAGVGLDFHLSDDPVLDATDQLLRTITLDAPIANGESIGGAETFSGLSPDDRFFIIATVDANDDVFEGSESNNRRAAGIGPDLTVDQVIARYSVSARKFVITIRIRNAGVRPAFGPIETRLDLYPGGPLQVLGTATFDGLGAGVLHEETVEIPFADAPVVIEQPMPLWFIGPTTDAADAVAETDEANNGSALTYVVWIP